MSDVNAGGPTLDFIRTVVEKDLASNKHGGCVTTRFPPEPNGYLHIGHAKAMSIDFGVALDYKGACNLRFDDTNPAKESMEYVEAIKRDIAWIGYEWAGEVKFASDYYAKLYEFAVELIKRDKAYVDDQTGEEIRDRRGSLTEPGENSPHRDRTVEENLDLFGRMRAGEFPDGARVLRAKIDMAAPNINMRDPVIYRILRATHYRKGDEWCIYPMYDFTHCLSDSLEGITHSLCDLEFEDHRPLYDWYLDQLSVPCHPQQIEFARLNLTQTVLSKRKLIRLVDEGHVTGWDDPRMPTLSGLRRRGYTPAAIRNFLDAAGIAKRNSVVDFAMLEHFLREDLNRWSPRVMGVLDPLKVVITNYPADLVEELEAINNPEDESAGTRRVPFSREFYIERADFMEDPPKKFFRLAPGREVRLRYAYLITCTDMIKDETGKVVELRCTYDPETRGGHAPDGRRVKATLHWVSVAHAVAAQVRLYDHLLLEGEGADFLARLNPNSVELLTGCRVERALAEARPGSRWQFERQGYFCLDSVDTTPGTLVFNRTVTLRDTWAKIQKQQK